MVKARLPENEEQRVAALRGYDVLDTLPEAAYDDITFLASHICETPIALVSLIDRERQWFKSKRGLEAAETSRDVAFCAHAILEPEELLVVPDAARDDRFADNPLVAGDPHIRFYAGAPLVTQGDEALGTLCVIDRKPRELSAEQRRALAALARQVMSQLELRRTLVRQEEYERRLEEANARLEVQSTTDSLTGLWNRRAFLERLSQEIERAQRYEARFAVAWLDIDYFKPYNDTFGHPAGDEVLRRVAALLRGSSRRADFVARCGGEEFAVILPNTTEAGAVLQAERIRRRVEEADWKLRSVTVSVGVVAWSSDMADASGLMAAADRALYRSKEGGRNRVSTAGG